MIGILIHVLKNILLLKLLPKLEEKVPFPVGITIFTFIIIFKLRVNKPLCPRQVLEGGRIPSRGA